MRALLSQVTRRAPQAVRHAKNVLSCAFAYGKEHIHGVKSNPCQGVKVTVPKVRRDRWLTDSEIETILEVLPRMKNQKAADIYLLILASLCRPGEAAGIEADDVITLNGERVWRVAEPKNGKDFLIPLEGPVREVIERRIAEVNGTGPAAHSMPAVTKYRETRHPLCGFWDADQQKVAGHIRQCQRRAARSSAPKAPPLAEIAEPLASAPAVGGATFRLMNDDEPDLRSLAAALALACLRSLMMLQLVCIIPLEPRAQKENGDDFNQNGGSNFDSCDHSVRVSVGWGDVGWS